VQSSGSVHAPGRRLLNAPSAAAAATSRQASGHGARSPRAERVERGTSWGLSRPQRRSHRADRRVGCARARPSAVGRSCHESATTSCSRASACTSRTPIVPVAPENTTLIAGPGGKSPPEVATTHARRAPPLHCRYSAPLRARLVLPRGGEQSLRRSRRTHDRPRPSARTDRSPARGEQSPSIGKRIRTRLVHLAPSGTEAQQRPSTHSRSSELLADGQCVPHHPAVRGLDFRPYARAERRGSYVAISTRACGMTRRLLEQHGTVRDLLSVELQPVKAAARASGLALQRPWLALPRCRPRACARRRPRRACIALQESARPEKR